MELGLIGYYGMLDKKMGYMKVRSLWGNGWKELKEGFVDLKKEGISCLVMEVGNKGGGLVEEGVEIGKLLVGGGKRVVRRKGKMKEGRNR